MATPILKHATVRLNGVRDMYVEELSFNESTEHQIRRFTGAYASEKSALPGIATITMTVGIPSTGAIAYRSMLRAGQLVNLMWTGGDGRITILDALVMECNETNPGAGGHNMSVTMTGVVKYG